MRSILAVGLTALALLPTTARADELKSGPEKKIGGSFQVTAITGGNKGKTLCYV
jgi:hypothetical protein